MLKKKIIIFDENTYFHRLNKFLPNFIIIKIDISLSSSTIIEYIHLELNHLKNFHAPYISVNQCPCIIITHLASILDNAHTYNYR